MMHSPRNIAAIAKLTLWFGVSSLALIGCQTPPTSAPPPPASTLRLVQAAPFELPASCDASGSYFVSFTVLADGRTAAIKTPPGSSCVHDALTAWVASFRYAPPSAPVETGVEWLLVSARRGS